MFDLLLISDDGPPQAGLATLERALQAPGLAGRVALQLRKKAWPAGQLLEAARALRPACRRAGVALLINDRVDVAVAAEADGVHLPEAGLQPACARRQLGEGALIGVSCHDAAGLRRAEAQAASFALLSPVFSTPGKGTPLGSATFGKLAAEVHLPVLALGGLTRQNAAELMAVGAAGVAVVRAVHGAPDPAAALEELLAVITKA